MPTWLARPYPVQRIADARRAIAAAAGGDVAPLHALYVEAADRLLDFDPDEVDDIRLPYRQIAGVDTVAARAAVEVSDTWEGIVVLGAAIADPARFRGFAWLAAQARYGSGASAQGLVRYKVGGTLPDTSAEDSALYAALPALIGLGPALPEEIPGACPLEGMVVAKALGLPGDWTGIDPLDGIAVTAEQCRMHLAGLDGPWREVVGLATQEGLLIRRA